MFRAYLLKSILCYYLLIHLAIVFSLFIHPHRQTFFALPELFQRHFVASDELDVQRA